MSKMFYRKIKIMEVKTMKKTLIAISLISLMTVFYTGIGNAQQNMTIESDRQAFGTSSDKTIFDGNVKVLANGVKITGDKAVVTMDNNGNPSLATITGSPKAVTVTGENKKEVTARIFKVSLLDNLAKAEGNVKSIVFEGKNPVVTITSEYQDFNKDSGIINASTNVKINYNDVSTISDKARITIGDGGKPKFVKLVGNATLKQGSSIIKAADFDYNPVTDELVATGSSYSQTLLDDGTTAHVWSNIQQFAKSKNSLIASGNVKIHYQNYIATGPKAVFLPDASGKMNKILLRGNSTIKEDSRQVSASKIEITINPKNFVAEGGVKTKFVQAQRTKPVSSVKK